MKFIGDCAECQRLWREYSAATTEHIKLEGKLAIAAIARDDESVIRLAPEVECAALTRLAARDAIKAHEHGAHPSAEGASA